MSAITLTLTQVADHIGVKKRTLYNMIGDGRFAVAPIPFSRPRRWHREHVDAWAAGRL